MPEILMDGEVPRGEVIDPMEINRGMFHPLDDQYLEQQVQLAKFEAQQRRRQGRKPR